MSGVHWNVAGYWLIPSFEKLLWANDARKSWLRLRWMLPWKVALCWCPGVAVDALGLFDTRHSGGWVMILGPLAQEQSWTPYELSTPIRACRAYPSTTEKDLILFFINSSYCDFSSVHVDRNGSNDGEGPLFQNSPGWWDVNLKTKPHRITGKRHMLLPAGCLFSPLPWYH